MKKNIFTCLVTISLFLVFSTNGLASQNDHIDQAIAWLIVHTNSTTHLIDSFDVDAKDPSAGVSWTYNQAQAIQTYLAVGDLQRAENLARALLLLKRTPDDVWFNAYNTKTGVVAQKIYEQNASWVGPNVAVAQAFLNILEVTDDQSLSKDLISSLISETQWFNKKYHASGNNGYLVGGRRPGEVYTEYAMRAFGFYLSFYNFLQTERGQKYVFQVVKSVNVDDLRVRGNHMINWIQTKMWTGDHYRPGCLDPQCRTFIPEMIPSLPQSNPRYYEQFALVSLQALGVNMAQVAGVDPESFAGGLDWSLKHLAESEWNGKKYWGVPMYVGTKSLWAAGTGGVAHALRLVHRDKEATQLRKTLKALQKHNGGVLTAIGQPEEERWPIHFPFEGIEGLHSFVTVFGESNAKFSP